MYERKIPFDPACGVHLTREVLAGKWKASLLYHIARGVQRPGELHQKLRTATRRVVHLHLNQLEAHELIGKTVFAETPPRVEYYPSCPMAAVGLAVRVYLEASTKSPRSAPINWPTRCSASPCW